MFFHVFAQTTHVVAAPHGFACVVIPAARLYIPRFIEIRSGVSDPQGVKIWPFPLLWLVAFTTACTTVQAVMFALIPIQKFRTISNSKQGFALTGRNHTSPLCSVAHAWWPARRQSMSPAVGRPAHRQRYRRRRHTTDASQQNNTGPLGGPAKTINAYSKIT